MVWEVAMSTSTWVRASIGLVVLGLFSIAAGHLALTDIYHARGDVSLEWNALRVCFGVIVISQVASLVALVKVVRQRAAPNAA